MPLRLIIEDDEGATTIVPLGKEAITIGRQQGNTIQLTEKNVSRNHARLFPEAEAWMIEDLNSYNGIKVNDKPVDGRMKLREGDIVQIGDYHLAITEDVDKRTLNYDRPGQAANDGVDPLLASSSADLPRLSPEEIHALSSGPQQITPPPSPMMLDSGPVPATPYNHGYAEPRKKGLGLWLFLGILALGAGGVVGIALINKPDGGGEPATTAKTDKPNAAGAGTKKQPPTPTPTPAAADDDAGVEPTLDEDDGTEPEPTDDPIEAVDPVPEPEPDPEPEPPNTNPDPVPTPPDTSDTKKKKKTTSTPKTNNTPPPPPDPPDTGPSAEELLADARKAQMGGNNGEAYRLAKQSYGKKKDSDSAQVMTMAGCKLGDKTKAKYGYSRMKAGKLKDDAKAFCALKGIEL